MAEYIDIDAPIDFAVYERNIRITATFRQFLEINDAKYQAADVVPVRHGKWVKATGMMPLKLIVIWQIYFCLILCN